MWASLSASHGKLSQGKLVRVFLMIKNSFDNLDRISRMGQFVSFTSIVAGGMFTLGAMLLLLAKGTGDPTVEAIVLVASLVIATIAIGLGAGSVPYTLMGELFPPEYRTLGSCVVLVVRSTFSTCLLCQS